MGVIGIINRNNRNLIIQIRIIIINKNNFQKLINIIGPYRFQISVNIVGPHPQIPNLSGAVEPQLQEQIYANILYYILPYYMI